MAHISEETEFLQRAAEIEQLALKARELIDPEARTLVQALLKEVMSLHGDCLERLLQVVETEQPSLLDRLEKEPIVNALMGLYGLHREPLKERVKDSIEKVRPYVKSHGGEVELLDVVGSMVKVRISSKGHACGLGSLQEAVEKSIYQSAPEVSEIVVEQPVPAPQLVQLR